jgi:hypothetical protein
VELVTVRLHLFSRTIAHGGSSLIVYLHCELGRLALRVSENFPKHIYDVGNGVYGVIPYNYLPRPIFLDRLRSPNIDHRRRHAHELTVSPYLSVDDPGLTENRHLARGYRIRQVRVVVGDFGSRERRADPDESSDRVGKSFYSAGPETS